MPVPSRMFLTQSNDQVIELQGLREATTLAYLNAATVSASLYDGSGNPVTGCTNITLSYVSSTDGVYRGFVQEGFGPALGEDYVLMIDASQAAAVLHMEIPTSVIVRTS